MAQLLDCTPIIPEQPDSIHEGCPVLTKRRHFIVTKGQCGMAEWQMRYADGTVVDLSDCFPETSVSESTSLSTSESEDVCDLCIKVRYQGCDRGRILATVKATVSNAAEGKIQFEIPNEVCCSAGLYVFQAAVLQDDKRVLFADDGMVSVEHGMWGDTTSMAGPPTIQTIRIALRDTGIENDLLQDVEFDDTEILECIRQPVMQFNEVPPPLSPFNCGNFPFRHHWREAIVAELLKIAAHHYVRNKMKATGGGLTVDDKAREGEYLQIAQMYQQKWETFIAGKKIEINAAGFWGSQGSTYGNGYYGS